MSARRLPVRRLLLRGAQITGAILALSAALWIFAPREGLGEKVSFDASGLGDDPELWLQLSEQRFPDIRPGAAKRILWAGKKGAKTPLSIVYIHGFGASAEEIRPVPDELARALGANLFFARLSGQGRSAEAMAGVEAGEWLGDMAEALAIGRHIGEEVLVIGTSLGGSLSALAARDPDLGRDMAGLILISPAFALHRPGSILIDAPLPGLWAPLLMGNQISLPPLTPAQEKYLLPAWPTAALYPLGALMREARAGSYAGAKMPLLVFYAREDQVTDPAAIAPVIAGWGGSVQLEERRMQAGDDPFAHVLAGDIYSPGQSEEVLALMQDWALSHLPAARTSANSAANSGAKAAADPGSAALP